MCYLYCWSCCRRRCCSYCACWRWCRSSRFSYCSSWRCCWSRLSTKWIWWNGTYTIRSNYSISISHALAIKVLTLVVTATCATGINSFPAIWDTITTKTLIVATAYTTFIDLYITTLDIITSAAKASVSTKDTASIC